MRKRVGGIVATAAVAVSLTGAAGASAAVDVGNECTANTAPVASLVQLSKGGGLPIATPISGVVTRWRVNVVSFPGTIPERLKVFRATGAANQFLTVAESDLGSVVAGPNNFATRIPVQAGDRFGAFGGTGTLACSTSDAADSLGVLAGDSPVGSTQTFAPSPRAQVAVAVTVEPDADGDGFGDETQDKCPQSAAVQAECPTIVLDSFAIVKRGSIVVIVSSSQESPVTVSATAGVAKKGKRGKGKGGRKPRATASALLKLRGGTKTVAPGQIVPFTLRFSKTLKARLNALPPGRSLSLRVTASATDVAGRGSASVLRVKLKG